MAIHPVLDFCNEEMTVVVGGKRCFKTLHAVYEAFIAYNHGYDIYTNVVLNPKYFKGMRDVKWKDTPESSKIESLPGYHLMNHEDARIFIEQLRDIMDIRKRACDFHPTFLLVDEASGVADSALWKDNAKDSDIWKQLGKVGITAYFVNQTFSQTYNRIRDNADVVKVCKRVSPLISDWYLLTVLRQSPLDHTKYDEVGATQIRMCATDVFKLYDTRQVLYLK